MEKLLEKLRERSRQGCGIGLEVDIAEHHVAEYRNKGKRLGSLVRECLVVWLGSWAKARVRIRVRETALPSRPRLHTGLGLRFDLQCNILFRVGRRVRLWSGSGSGSG